MTTIIRGGKTVSDGRITEADVVIEGDLIATEARCDEAPRIVDARGCYVLPGIIDTHVHFREPGLTHKASIHSESLAALAGGVTSFCDMPNCVPQTTMLEALEEKRQIARQTSHANYAFFLGATADNHCLYRQLDKQHVAGIKLFMGSSTGGMLVDDDTELDKIFAAASAAGLPIVAHCEDQHIININAREAANTFGIDPPLYTHHLIRSHEACLNSTLRAIALATKHDTKLHIAHVSTREEAELFQPTTPFSPVTMELCVGHLLFNFTDIDRLGSRIKVNPAIKRPVDQLTLQQQLSNGCATTVATDHAPHLLSEKEGAAGKAASGMPMVQFSLVSMLGLVDRGVLSLERIVELMAHNPALLFGIEGRGFIRPGYKADLVIVRPDSSWTLTPDKIISSCQWSPLEGTTFSWQVEKTFCNGQLVYDIDKSPLPDQTYIAKELSFKR